MFVRRSETTYVWHHHLVVQYYIIKVTYPVPPYGRDKASDLQSIFEIKHLKARAYFLNTQCMS